uniref:Cytochrome P450 1A n=1 Tax=Pseudonaja textilis TaxID=8673 RepID=A0A670Y556_PSETE
MAPETFAMDEVSFSGVIIALCIVVSLFIYVRMLTKNKQPYPPGPWSLPILGNLLQLGDHPYVFFDQMRKKYGDVFQIQLGMVPVVVVNGLHAARHVLLKDGESFAGRPDILSFSVKFGESWNLQKKVAAKALKSLAKSEARSSTCSCLLEEHVCAEASERMKTFLELSKKGSFDPVAATTCTVANVVSALCFGKRYSQCDEEFLSIIQMSHGLIKASSIFNPADFIPCLRYLPLPAAKVARAFYGKFNNFLAQHVKDHYVTYGKNVLRDITDALINVSNERKADDKIVTLSNENIIITVNDIFGAGFGTLSSCLQWIFLYLTNNPEIQMKIQEEIGNAFVAPKFEDRKDLHYTEAFINEVFRHSSFIPFTKPHCTTKDTVLNGYYIPQNTCIFINMYQVNHDENLWIDPDIFKPQRFLNENGEFNKSLIEKILIFGIGLRKCLGEEIFLILTTILQQLRLEKLFEDQLEITPVYGLSMTPKP